jgi:PAS domain S-box-containing protein
MTGAVDSLGPRVLQEEPASLGDWLEIAGLAFGASVLCLLLGSLHGRRDLLGWQLWGVQLLLIAWASVRQGLRGGTLVAATAAVAASWLPLVVRAFVPPANEDILFRPLLQAHLLAQYSAAVLVAAATSWIRKQEKGYRQIVAHIPVVIYSVRVAGRREVTLASAACARVFGCPAETLLGDYDNWLARVQPEDREMVAAAIDQLARQDQPVTCEYRVEGRWLRDTLAPQRDNEGRLLGWDGIVIDVSEQRALADDLRRTTSMFNALVSNLPTGVFFVQGPHGQPILVNARARQLLGQCENPTSGLDYLSRIYRLFRADGTLYPNDELPVCVALREGRTTMRDDIVVYRPDGRRVPLVTWAAPVQLGARGGQDAAVWVLEDLSALRFSEERYRTLVDSLPVMLIQANRKLEITYINPATKAISGYDLTEISDPASWSAIIHPADLPRAQEIARNALNGRPDRGEIRYRAKDGTEKVAYLLSQPRYHEGIGAGTTGQSQRSTPAEARQGGSAGGSQAGAAPPREGRGVIGTTTLLLDVTRERNLERELQRAGRLELIGRLSSGVANDFNNLLGVVLNLTDLAGAHLPADHPVHADLKRIADASEQAAGLASQLLAFSQQKPALPSRVEVNTVARRTLELLRATLPGAIRVECDLSTGGATIEADETQVQQVLMNLCLNARDAMPEGGTLRVCTRVQSPGNETRNTRAWVCLSVEDSGTGISEEVRNRIFEPYFSTREGGTGLGLAVVQQIVEAFGGTIEVYSKQGEGARFDVRWPLAPTEIHE